MAWYDSKYFRFGIDSKTQTINGSSMRMDLDNLSSFMIGKTKNTFYPETTKFVELQEQNFVLNNVITKIAKTFSNGSFTDENEKSEILNKINNPNITQSKEEFLKEFAIYIMSAGFTVIWKRYVSFGNFKTLELININPDTVEENENDTITFEYNDKSETALKSDLIFFYDIKKRKNSIKGYSRSTPLKSQIENIRDAQIAKGIQIENSGTTIVSPKVSQNNNSVDEGLNGMVPVLGGNLKTQKEEMEERLNTRGIANRIIVSSKGLDANNLSAQLNAVKFYEIVETDVLAIYDAYGFPIELSPYGKNATFENKGVAELSLIENEVLPLAENLINTLNAEFENKGKLDVSYKNLNAMSIVEGRIQDTNQKTIDQYGVLFDKGIITDQEYKKVLKSKNILE
jgi:hypothetical protein